MPPNVLEHFNSLKSWLSQYLSGSMKKQSVIGVKGTRQAAFQD
jgi:NH3-dependent NAD+ synthetase